jgi:uncharacterized protein YgbK (DUF1537 family)
LPGAVVADDLTGAMDGGVQLLARSEVEVLVSGAADARPATANSAMERGGSGVLPVVNTQSRGLAPGAAAARVRAACHELSVAGRTVWFKKLDSTLRGNVGAELAAVHEALAPCVIVCTPALPAEGRTVADGVLLVEGEPVMATPYRDEIPAGRGAAADSSAVVDIVRRQWPGCRAVHLPAPSGAGLQAALRAAPDLVAADAASDADLLSIATAAGSAADPGRRLVWAGSAGLLRALTLTGASPDVGVAAPCPALKPSQTTVTANPPAISAAEASTSPRHTTRPAEPPVAAPAPERGAQGPGPPVQPTGGVGKVSHTRFAEPDDEAAVSDSARRVPEGTVPALEPARVRSDPALPGSAGGACASRALRQAHGAVVVVCGSRRAVARSQVGHAAAAARSSLTVSMTGVPGVAPHEPRWRFAAAGGTAPTEANGSTAAVHCAAALDRRQDLFLCVPPPPDSTNANPSLPAEQAEAVAAALSALFASALEAAAERPAALLLVGGDTAYACLQRLAIARLTLAGEAEPYVPRARVSGGPWQGMTVITKAGGFGDPHTLSRICARLREDG